VRSALHRIRDTRLRQPCLRLRRRAVEQARHFLTMFMNLNVFNALARNERARLTSG
jgi:hypothetical protein